MYGPYASKKRGDEPNNPEKRRKGITLDALIRTDAAMLSAADGHGELLDGATVSQYPHARLCLYALEVTFPHPVTKQETTFKMDEPSWYQELREYQERLSGCR